VFGLSGRGLCDELITLPEESYRLRCVVVRDLQTSVMRRQWPALGRSTTGKIVSIIHCIQSRNSGLKRCYCCLSFVVLLGHCDRVVSFWSFHSQGRYTLSVKL